MPAGGKKLGRPISRRQVIGAGSAGLLAAGVAACGRSPGAKPSGASSGSQAASSAQGAPVAGGTLNVYVNYNAPLDPQQTSGVLHEVDAGVYSRVFRFKTDPDPATILNHDLDNELGLSAETPDGQTWTVRLRPDARFSNTAPVNGRAVDSQDVKTTFIRALDPATNNPNQGQLSMIDPAQIQTPDPNTVVFRLNYVYAPFNKTLASPSYSLILPKETASGGVDPTKTVIGSGPFTLDSAVPDVAYTYRRNPAYFEKNIPNVDTVRLAVVVDTSQQQAQFTAGNLDELTLDSPFSLATEQQSNPKAVLVQPASGITYAVYYQMKDPTSIFRDLRVRRAFNMAIDRDTLGKVILNGESVTCWLIPAYMGKWSITTKDLPASTQQYYQYNLSEAKKMLAAAGVSNLQFRLVYQNREATPAFVKQVETVANMLEALGLQVNPVSVDYTKEWIAGGKGINAGYYPKDTLVYSGISTFTEADEYLHLALDSRSTQSHMTVQDPSLDAMIDKERATLDENQRLQSVRSILSYAADQAYYVPTVGDKYADTLIQPRVRNYSYTSTPAKLIEMYAKLWLAS